MEIIEIYAGEGSSPDFQLPHFTVVIRQEGEIGEIHLPRMSSLIDREIVQFYDNGFFGFDNNQSNPLFELSGNFLARLPINV